MRLADVQTPDGQMRYVLLDDDGSLVEPVVRYLKHLDQRGLARNTLRTYGLSLKHWFTYLRQKQLDYRGITLDDVGDFIFWLKLPYQSAKVLPSHPVTQARSNRTINHILKAVSGFYDYLWRRDEVDADLNAKLLTALPSLRRPYTRFLQHLGQEKPARKHLLRQPEPKQRSVVLTSAQVEQLVAACTNSRDRLLVTLLYETGLRIGEALGLWLEDVDIAGRRLQVSDRGELPNGAAVKTPAAVRSVDVSAELINRILDYVAEAHTEQVVTNHLLLIRTGPRTGQPLTYPSVYDLFRRLQGRTGIEVTPHHLRHTHFTLLAKAGWQPEHLQQRAGHASFEYTYQLYVHPSPEDLREAWERTEREISLRQRIREEL